MTSGDSWSHGVRPRKIMVRGKKNLGAVLSALAFVTLVIAPAASAAPDEPRWKAFVAGPLVSGVNDDVRKIFCHPAGVSMSAGCDRDARGPAGTSVWDGAAASFTTSGPYVAASLSDESPMYASLGAAQPTSPTRDYISPWTNSWRNASCDPTVFASAPPPTSGSVFGGTDTADVNAAIINVFATLNRLHHWSYGLGFTERRFNFQSDNPPDSGGLENDPIVAAVQGAALPGGEPKYLADPAPTPADGTSPTVRTYLWQPAAATFYGPCVDGSFDGSVIAQQYGRLLVDRMVGGGADGSVKTSAADGQAAALREGFADAVAVAFLNDSGAAGSVVGAYVSDNAGRGLRSYDMSASPLNYSDVQGWDGSGAGTASDDGEIWAAALYDVRAAYVAKYPGDGERRWIQLIFDALPDVPADATMVGARNAMIAQADSADRAMVWRAFASDGLGQRASGSVNAAQPTPSFESPVATNEATVTFSLRASDEGNRAIKGKVFVGQYEAKVTPVADTNSRTALVATAKLVPGQYAFVFQAPGYGVVKKTLSFPASSKRTVTVFMPTNRASRTKGAGGGAAAAPLLDDTEATNWTASAAAGTVASARPSVTVNLAGSAPVLIDRVSVSALLRPADLEQNRFTALHTFQLYRCTAAGRVKCTRTRQFAPLGGQLTPFAAGEPRPVPADLNLRTIDVPNRKATHLRLVVLENQCTGASAYAFEDADPGNVSACEAGAPDVAGTVRAAELEVFSRPAVVRIR